MKYTLIVPSGGIGSRVGAELPKQYIEVNGKTILHWTLSKFSDFDEISQLLIPADNSYLAELESSIPSSLIDKYKITQHGATRFNSIYNAIEHINPDTDYIIIHDAVRPYIDRNLISHLLEKVQKHHAIVPYMTPTDTIKSIDPDKREDFIEKTLDRELLAAVQTPQVFERKLFIDSYEYAKKNQFKGTDDSSILEYSNFFPKLILGNSRNLKITTDVDVQLANFLLKS